MASLRTLDEAQMLVLEHARPLEEEPVAVADAAGRVAAEDVRAAVDLPPFPSSAMDGYAVRSADVPGTLAIVGEAAAGSPADRSAGAGEAIAISTGGVVPAGADAVVPVEDVVQKDNAILVAGRWPPGANVRPQGGDARAGEVVLAAGARIRAAQVGALAAAGVVGVSCRRRPRVVVLATGSELVEPGTPLALGEVYEANGVMLAAALRVAGCDVEVAPVVADDEAAHRDALARGLEGDVLVTSGGVSVGPHDLVRDVERELGVDEVFWRVAIKPGKPVSFGVRGRTLVFGLPGNPVSALVGCELFVKPAIRALQGLERPLPPLDSGVLGTALRRNETRDDFVRARVRATTGGPVLEPLVGQESHMIVRAAAADGLVHVPRGEGELAAGSRVAWLPLDRP